VDAHVPELDLPQCYVMLCYGAPSTCQNSSRNHNNSHSHDDDDADDALFSYSSICNALFILKKYSNEELPERLEGRLSLAIIIIIIHHSYCND
jgi:hypothetical protein